MDGAHRRAPLKHPCFLAYTVPSQSFIPTRSKDKKAFESAVVGRSTLLMLAVSAFWYLYRRAPTRSPISALNPEDAYLLRYLSFFIVSGMAFLMAVSAAATTKKIAVPVFIKNMGLRIAMIALAFVLFFTQWNFSLSAIGSLLTHGLL